MRTTRLYPSHISYYVLTKDFPTSLLSLLWQHWQLLLGHHIKLIQFNGNHLAAERSLCNYALKHARKRHSAADARYLFPTLCVFNGPNCRFLNNSLELSRHLKPALRHRLWPINPTTLSHTLTYPTSPLPPHNPSIPKEIYQTAWQELKCSIIHHRYHHGHHYRTHGSAWGLFHRSCRQSLMFFLNLLVTPKGKPISSAILILLERLFTILVMFSSTYRTHTKA